MACIRTDSCVVEDVEDIRLRSLPTLTRLQLPEQPSFIHDVQDLPQSLITQSLHDGGKQHLKGQRSNTDTHC